MYLVQPRILEVSYCADSGGHDSPQAVLWLVKVDPLFTGKKSNVAKQSYMKSTTPNSSLGHSMGTPSEPATLLQ